MTRSSPIVPNFLAGWVQLLVPDQCFQEFFVEFNLLNVACYKLVLSKLLGYFIVCSSLFVKVPQIMKIWKAGSSVGISLVALLIELSVLEVAIVYCLRNGFPFSTYGELLFMFAQTMFQTSLVIHFSPKAQWLVPFNVGAISIFVLIGSPIIPLSVMRVAVGFTTLFGLTGKILQSWAIYRNGGTGVLSGVTVFMFVFNGIARIYTTVMELGDVMIITNYSLVTAINIVIAGQMWYYWNAAVEKKNKSS